MKNREFPWYLVFGLIIGVNLGMLVSWVISPVHFVDNSPASLRAEYKDQYRSMIALAYFADSDLNRAQARLDLLGDGNSVQALAAQAQDILTTEGNSGPSGSEVRAMVLLAAAMSEAYYERATQAVIQTGTQQALAMLPTSTHTPSSTPSETPVPTDTETPYPTETPTLTLTATPSDTLTPTPTPTEIPTDTPTNTPDFTDTPVPTEIPPTDIPATPTIEAATVIAATPFVDQPTEIPTDTPTEVPPTETPTDVPPTETPTSTATNEPPTETLTPTEQASTATPTPTEEAKTETRTPTSTKKQPTRTSTRTATDEATNTPTRQPTIKPTSTKEKSTPTPVPTAIAAFELESLENVCDSDIRDGLLQVDVTDSFGNPLPGIRLTIAWSGGENSFFTGFKPAISQGYADFVMQDGMVYTLKAGEGGELVRDLLAETCEDDGDEWLGGIHVVFTQP